MMKFCKKYNCGKGIALIIVLALVAVITVVGLSFIIRGDTELLCGQNMEMRADMDYLAESGLEHAKGLIMYPQDITATEYFTGAAAQQLVSGGNDYYDVSVTKLSDCNWQITSSAYRQTSGSRTAQCSLTARMRLDPAVAFWSGTTVTLDPCMIITGDVYCNGVLTNSGSINGDCFADSPPGGTITGSWKPKTDLQLGKPDVNCSRLISNFATQTIGAYLTGVSYSGSPEVYYKNGDLGIGSNVNINGCLAVKGNLTIWGSSNVITAKKNVPAIYVSGNLIMKEGAGLDCNGLVFVDGRIDMSIINQSMTVTGSLFTDDGIRYIVRDYSGNDHDGIVNGNCTRAPGYISGAINFDGDGDYIDIGNPDFGITELITIAAWIKVTAFDKTSQAIVTKGDTSWRLQRYLDTDHIEFACTGVGSVVSNRNVNDGHWHHIAGVYDGVGNRIFLYVDGTEDANQVASGSISTNSASVYIGGNSVSGRWFNGIIDEVLICDRRLAPIEIEQLHSGETIEDPVGYWRMDNGGYAATINAAPTRAAIYHWPSGLKDRWSPVAGAFYKSITRNP
jgi:hypothetical protein